MHVLVVIPARGGSKGIPRKNVRLIGGRPLISHAVALAAASKADAVIVTSDHDQILEVAAETAKVHRRKRPSQLAADATTLDPVVHDAVVAYEEEAGRRVDVVVTLQPTSPLMRQETFDRALAGFLDSDQDTLISVVEDIHLRWRVTDDEGIQPAYAKRVNRQWLPREYRETGAFVMSRRDVVTPTSRLGEKVDIFPMPVDQSLDIDSPLDWYVASALIDRRRFIALVNGNRSVGLGHVYRVLTLGDQFLGHDFRVVTWDSMPAVVALMKKRGHRVEIVESQDAALRLIQEERPDIVINDLLDTEIEMIERQRGSGAFIVNFEDLGWGNLRADLVVNALYEMSDPPPTHVSGARYVCLDQNFIIERPAAFRDKAKTLLTTFGGADENNLTLRIAKMLPDLFERTSLERAIIVVGPGYAHHDSLDSFLGGLKEEIRRRILVERSVTNMARFMRKADLAATSNGGTVYELASMLVPAVVISQNDRETSHLWSRYTQGVDYLGMAASVEDAQIFGAIARLASDDELRSLRRDALAETDIRGGAKRVHDTILYAYWEWKNAKDPTR